MLDADYLLELVNDDPVRTLLRWLDDPQGHRARTDDARWKAFVQQCKADYGFDPTVDGEVSAARKLGTRQPGWANVWKRFAESPERYPGVPEQLRKARPQELIVENLDAWPQDNEMGEDQLRSRLRDFGVLTPEGARKESVQLDGEHGWRRGTVWADLDQAPLAFALEQLVALGELTQHPLSSGDFESLVSDYAERGWRADDALLRALAAVSSGRDREAVSAAAGRVVPRLACPPEPKHSRQRSGHWRTPTPTKPASQHRQRRGRSRCSSTACASTSVTEYTRVSLTLASTRRSRRACPRFRP